MSAKKISILCLAILFTRCTKSNKTFSMKTITLNDYLQINLPAQKLYLEIFDDKSTTALARTAQYPSELTLPVTFMVHPSLQMTLYNKNYRIQLWGDVTGYISSCQIKMDSYKIIYPIDMEVSGDSLNISIAGNWK